jgi:purple acid phosphatase-like protein
MPISEPLFEWQDPPKETQRPVLPKHHHPEVEVYELAKSPSPPGFFNNLAKFASFGVVGVLLVVGGLWAYHRSQSTIKSEVPADAENVASTPDTSTVANEHAPQVGYVKSWGITDSMASISWSTNVASTSAVAYGTTSALGEVTDVQTAQTIAHGVQLTGLKPATTYYFVAQSADADGVVGYSTANTFTTRGAGPAPVISDIKVVPATNNQVKISWTTSVPTSSFVQIGKTTTYDRWSKRTEMTTNPQPEITWVPSGVIHYQVVSVDAKGNQATSPDQTFIEP